jgi:hypothetical protein
MFFQGRFKDIYILTADGEVPYSMPLPKLVFTG